MMKPYYQDDAVTIYHGDCREVLATPTSLDAIITDPPYGTGKLGTAGASYTVLPKRERFDWDVWDDSWLTIAKFKCAAFFCPPKELGKYLQSHRLLAAVAKQTVAVKNVSPRYGLQPIVLVGTPPTTYALDWCEFINDGRRTAHPCEKPLNIMRWLVQVCTVEGDTILDPFAGSGTTLRAAKDLGRKSVGIEIDERYCEIAAKRMAQSVMNFAL